MAYPNYCGGYQPQQFYQPQNFHVPDMSRFQMQQQQNNGGIVWVSSEMEAQSFLIAPNSAVTFFNSNLPEVYLKKTDASGRPTFEAYALVKRADKPQESTGATDTHGDLMEKITALEKRVAEIEGKKEESSNE